ncbi:MAG: hypothetical protein EOP83_04015 [Verrucomicrobiaceae bacterium]|nr:MAG: hypothetical protein EOP83_04015 [Verrucomicrobiaceae bacterium]
MRIEYKTGDLLAGPEAFICHGCNAQGVMGSGIAKTIRDIYPNAYTTYRDRYENLGLGMGSVIWVECKPTDSRYRARTVIDAITQEHYGRDPNRVYVSYEAIEKAITAIDKEAVYRQHTPSKARSHGLIESVGPGRGSPPRLLTCGRAVSTRAQDGAVRARSVLCECQ